MLTRHQKQFVGAAIFVTIALGIWGCASSSYSPPGTPSPVGPSITTQPANQTVTVGATAAFTVVAAGTAPLSYQWQKNSANISGATAASYTTPATVAGDNDATFRVIVTNSVSNITRKPAPLTLAAQTPAAANVTSPHHTDIARTRHKTTETILT